MPTEIHLANNAKLVADAEPNAVESEIVTALGAGTGIVHLKNVDDAPEEWLVDSGNITHFYGVPDASATGETW